MALIWILGTFILIVGIFFLCGYYFLIVATKPKVMSLEEIAEYEKKVNGTEREAFERIEKEARVIEGYDGVPIHGYLIRRDTEKLVIICHGYLMCFLSAVKYMNIFLEKDYSVFVYDQRFHGKSGGHFSSFGYYESKDLDCIIKTFKAEGFAKKIGLLGESMGGATVLQYLVDFNHIDFAICDCSFSSLTESLLYRMKYDYGFGVFSKWILKTSNIMAKIIQGWSFEHVKAEGELQNMLTPILFVHGLADKFLPFQMSEKLYNEKRMNKSIYLVEGARHTKCITQNPEKYKEKVFEFLETYGNG